MAFNPITSTEIINGAPADTALFGKVKNNFDNHEMRLVNEEMDANLVRAYQIVIDDEDGIYDALNIEQALEEVMTLVLANQVNNVSVFNNFGTRITSLEGRMDLAEDDIDLINSNILTLAGRVTSTESVNTSQGSSISNLQGRMTTAESDIVLLQGRATSIEGVNTSQDTEINTLKTRATTIEGVNTTQNTNIARNTSQLSMQVSSINEPEFLANLVVNTGSVPIYNSAASGMTGIGAMQTTTAAQEITYNPFIPVNVLLGAAMCLTYSAPVGTSMTFGFKCYTSAQALISNKTIISAQGGTGSFVHSQGHCKAEGAGAENFPVGTRFVKPYIVWTGNTGTINFDFMSVQPLGFSQYALFVD
jgi:hypothetical protein